MQEAGVKVELLFPRRLPRTTRSQALLCRQRPRVATRGFAPVKDMYSDDHRLRLVAFFDVALGQVGAGWNRGMSVHLPAASCATPRYRVSTSAKS